MRNFFEPRLQYTFAIAGVVVGGVSAGYSIYAGEKQRSQAAKINSSNPYPTQDVPQAEKDNQQLALQMANEGLPSQQYALAMTNIQRQQRTALREAQDRRAGLGLVGRIQQHTNDATAALDVANANARLSNKRALLGVNNRVAGYQQAAFDWNQKNRYNQQYNYAMNLQGAGNANIVHGADVLGATALRYGKGLFGNGSSGYDPRDYDPNYYGKDPLGPGPDPYAGTGYSGTI